MCHKTSQIQISDRDNLQGCFFYDHISRNETNKLSWLRSREPSDRYVENEN